jgi:uncharacterized protein YqeY
MKARLQEEMKVAMKAREKVKLETIRSLISAIKYEEIQKGVEDIPEDASIALLQREVKKRKEEMEFAEKANRPELIEKLKEEMACIEAFLPAQLGAEELEKIVRDLKDKNPGANMGAIMKSLQEGFSGRYNGKLASDIVKKVLG